MSEKPPQPECQKILDPPIYFKLYTKIRPTLPLITHLTHKSLIDFLYNHSLDSRVHKKADTGSMIFMIAFGLVLNKVLHDIFTLGNDYKAILKQIFIEVRFF